MQWFVPLSTFISTNIVISLEQDTPQSRSVQVERWREIRHFVGKSVENNVGKKARKDKSFQLSLHWYYRCILYYNVNK